LSYLNYDSDTEKVYALFGNDDADVYFSNLDTLFEFRAIDTSICESLGIELSEKSFYSISSILFEEYNHSNFEDKS
jgi:hypothetical protein